MPTRKRIRSTVDRSLHCRSSSKTTVGRRDDARPKSRPTASNTRSRPASSPAPLAVPALPPAVPAAVAPADVRSGTRTARSAVIASSSRSWSSTVRTTWVHGHSAGAWSSPQQVPHTARASRSASSAAYRCNSDVLPIPASPVTSTSETCLLPPSVGRAFRTPSLAVRSWANASARPTKGDTAAFSRSVPRLRHLLGDF
jgi:hypothetical protein